MVAGGAVLVMCICAGGVLFSVLRNGKGLLDDQKQRAATERETETETETETDTQRDAVPEDDEQHEAAEGAGVGPLIPRP